MSSDNQTPKFKPDERWLAQSDLQIGHTIPVTATHVAEKKLFVSKKLTEKLRTETHQITNSNYMNYKHI